MYLSSLESQVKDLYFRYINIITVSKMSQVERMLMFSSMLCVITVANKLNFRKVKCKIYSSLLNW